MENQTELREKKHVYKFSAKENQDVSDPFYDKLRNYVRKLKIPTKSEKINYLNETLGISAGKIFK